MEDGGRRLRHLYWLPGTDAHGYPFDGGDQPAAPVVETKGVCTVPVFQQQVSIFQDYTTLLFHIPAKQGTLLYVRSDSCVGKLKG
jgi:hypothetical protein